MSHIENAYDLKKEESGQDLRFFFISRGKQDIIKVVQYAFIQKLDGMKVYNLGFGDYNLDNDLIIDDSNANNGDAYKVFNTVLNTIPIFFEKYVDGILMVQGSDGSPAFIETCRTTCAKNCGLACKNHNRRINVYSGYVDKNFEELQNYYRFLGGTTTEHQEIILEPYQNRKKYDSVLLFQKKRKFTL